MFFARGTVSRLMGVTAGMVLAVSAAAQSSGSPTANGPAAFSTSEYTDTRVSAQGFIPSDSTQAFHTSGSLGRFGDTGIDQHFYAPIDIPQGAIVDFIGLNNLNDGTAGIMTATLLTRDSAGHILINGSLACTAHITWSTDFNTTPIGSLWQAPEPGILDVHILSSPNQQFFGHVDVKWRRTVSPAPGTATFTDVPTTHQFFQFIEALHAAGITGGCQASPPKFCPDNPVTRGEIAVFLATALGLNWPN
jgi:hypothetical protein